MFPPLDPKGFKTKTHDAATPGLLMPHLPHNEFIGQKTFD